MFGYVTVNYKKLTPEERKEYKKNYCSLCSALYNNFGRQGSRTLSFDMTFLAVLLNSIYDDETVKGDAGADSAEPQKVKCPAFPFKKRIVQKNDVFEYCANMNLLLYYLKYLDDWKDDKNASAKKKAMRLEKYLPLIKSKYTRQYNVIMGVIEELGEMEKRNELNSDLPVNCFARLMGEIFVFKQDETAPLLYSFGESLGRFIYLLDCCNDLKKDIKKKRYNPLVASMNTNWKDVLTLFMGEGSAIFEKLPLKKNVTILQNILYSGVWQRYKRSKNRNGAKDDTGCTDDTESIEGARKEQCKEN